MEGVIISILEETEDNMGVLDWDGCFREGDVFETFIVVVALGI